MPELFKKGNVKNLFKKANQAGNLFKKVASKAPAFLEKGADIAGKVQKQADIIEKQTRGTVLEPVSGVAKAVGDVARVAQKGFMAGQAISRGKTKEALKEVEEGVLGIKQLSKKKK